MATLADSGAGEAQPAGLINFIDRWIYAMMAGLFLAAVLAGFVPDSLAKVEAVRAGLRPAFPALLHLHAVLMGAWLLLLLTQATLMATNHRARHQLLGVAAFALAPTLLIVGVLLVPTMQHQLANAILHGPPEVAAGLRPTFEFMLNIMLVQMRIGAMFAVLIALGLAARRRDAGLHKRLMILGTAAPLPAATDRITWLPTSFPDSPLTVDLWPMALIAPMFLWDLYRLGYVHRAYLIYLAINLLVAIPLYLLWNTPWWRETALWLLGISGL